MVQFDWHKSQEVHLILSHPRQHWKHATNLPVSSLALLPLAIPFFSTIKQNPIDLDLVRSQEP